MAKVIALRKAGGPDLLDNNFGMKKTIKKAMPKKAVKKTKKR